MLDDEIGNSGLKENTAEVEVTRLDYDPEDNLELPYNLVWVGNGNVDNFRVEIDVLLATMTKKLYLIPGSKGLAKELMTT